MLSVTNIEICVIVARYVDREFELADIDDLTLCQITSDSDLNPSLDVPQNQTAEPLIPQNHSTPQSDDCPQILLSAPTGKVANLLGQRSQVPGYTLHQVKYSFHAHQTKLRSCSSDEINKPWKFSKVEVLIVDECSLVCVHMFATVLSMLLKYAELCKIVLLGDIKQLPSIEPGEN